MCFGRDIPWQTTQVAFTSHSSSSWSNDIIIIAGYSVSDACQNICATSSFIQCCLPGVRNSTSRPRRHDSYAVVSADLRQVSESFFAAVLG